MEQQNESFEQPAASKNPRLGIASVALSLLGLIMYCVPFTFGLFVGFTANLQLLTDLAGLISVLNVVGYCGNFLGFIGLILGGVSIYQDEKKGLGIAGVVLGLLGTCACLAGILTSL